MFTVIKEYLPLVILGFNVAMFIVIKFNDLKHLESSVKELTDTLKETNKNLVQNNIDLAELKGKCKANHGN